MAFEPPRAAARQLDAASIGPDARVVAVRAPASQPDRARWPGEIGFLPDERVSVRARHVAGFELQGRVLFGPDLAGVLGALAVAWVGARFAARGQLRPLTMELPGHHRPAPRNIAIRRWQRVLIFGHRVGTIILVPTVALWAPAGFPAPPPGATGAAIECSVAGVVGKALAGRFEPTGCSRQIGSALVPGLAAREVAASALGAVCAPRCLVTLATVERETGGRARPPVKAGDLLALAHAAGLVTCRVALALGGRGAAPQAVSRPLRSMKLTTSASPDFVFRFVIT